MNRILIHIHGIYTRQKKKRTTTIFPLRSPVNWHEIVISVQILLKLDLDLDEYLYCSSVGRKHIKARDKEILEALIQRYCLHESPSMFYISKV